MTVFGARLRPRAGCAHIDVSVYAGPDVEHLGRCGTLTMRPDEARDFAAKLDAADTPDMAAMDALLGVDRPVR